MQQLSLFEVNTQGEIYKPNYSCLYTDTLIRWKEDINKKINGILIGINNSYANRLPEDINLDKQEFIKKWSKYYKINHLQRELKIISDELDFRNKN